VPIQTQILFNPLSGQPKRVFFEAENLFDYTPNTQGKVYDKNKRGPAEAIRYFALNHGLAWTSIEDDRSNVAFQQL